MAKAKTRGKKGSAKSRPSKRKRQRSSQTNQPFEQDVKRRIGQFGGAGEPPIMK